MANSDRAAWERYRRRVVPELYERQGGRCALCGVAIDLEADGRGSDGASVDHVHPLVLGGALIPDATDAVRLVHKRCNSARGNNSRRATRNAGAGVRQARRRVARADAPAFDVDDLDADATPPANGDGTGFSGGGGVTAIRN